MKKIYISILLAIFHSGIVFANTNPEFIEETTLDDYGIDYEPMIREDRIWEYQTATFDSHPFHSFLFRMKFNGTEEINDRIYHRLEVIYVSELICEFEEGYEYRDQGIDLDYSKLVSVMVVERKSLDNLPVFLMREEDGIVYILYKTGGRYKSFELESNDYYEYVLYDFTKKVGETFTGIYNDETYSLVNRTREITDISIVRSCGKRYKRFENGIYYGNRFTDFPSSLVEVIEGIGPTRFCSCLAVFNNKNVEYSAYHSNYKCNHLNNVYDLEGNIVFEGINEDRYAMMLERQRTAKISTCEAGVNISYDNSHLVISGTNAMLTVNDVSGRTVLSQQVEGGDRVDVSELPSGIYIAALSTGAKLKIRK